LHRRREKPLAPWLARRTGTLLSAGTFHGSLGNQEVAMNAIIYLVGLVVVIMFILSFIGLR
jgi:hypothetical protein